MGEANGIMGAFTVLGASAGFGMFSYVLDVEQGYVFYATILLVCSGITLVCVRSLCVVSRVPKAYSKTGIGVLLERNVFVVWWCIQNSIATRVLRKGYVFYATIPLVRSVITLMCVAGVVSHSYFGFS